MVLVGFAPGGAKCVGCAHPSRWSPTPLAGTLFSCDVLLERALSLFYSLELRLNIRDAFDDLRSWRLCLTHGVYVVFLCACSAQATQEPVLLPKVAIMGACAHGLKSLEVQVEPQMFTLGVSPNEVVRSGDDLFIAESGSNTVSKVNVRTRTHTPSFIDVGNNKNPYNVSMDQEHVFITNYLAQSVTVADRHTGTVHKEITSPLFQGPSGVLVTNDLILVTNVNYRGATKDYGEGSVVLIDKSSLKVLGAVHTQKKNPQYVIKLEDVASGVRVAVISTGALGKAQGRYTPRTPGAVEVFTFGEAVLEPKRELAPLELSTTWPSRGAPGQAMRSQDGAYLYVVSATAPVVFKLSLKDMTWSRGVDDPIVLYESSEDTLHHAALDQERGLMYITSFNKDELLLLDTACDEVVPTQLDLGHVPDLLEGPHGLVVHPLGVYFITSNSGVLGRILVTIQ